VTANHAHKQHPSREIVPLPCNSVAHANYEITDTSPAHSVRSWNTYDKGTKTWEAAFVLKLLVRLGDVLHKYYHSVHHA